MTQMAPSGPRRARAHQTQTRGRTTKKLSDHFAPNALIHYGQGKWYPGELLPRWALSCYWRKDRVPVWESAQLIAEDDKDYGYTSEDARNFLEALTLRLQVDASAAMPAYEDTSTISGRNDGCR
jgi:uncharacterized protein (DUF2126 family)